MAELLINELTSPWMNYVVSKTYKTISAITFQQTNANVICLTRRLIFTERRDTWSVFADLGGDIGIIAQVQHDGGRRVHLFNHVPCHLMNYACGVSLSIPQWIEFSDRVDGLLEILDAINQCNMLRKTKLNIAGDLYADFQHTTKLGCHMIMYHSVISHGKVTRGAHGSVCFTRLMLRWVPTYTQKLKLNNSLY